MSSCPTFHKAMHTDELNPNAPCGFCREEYGLEYELVIVESGRMIQGRKAKDHLFFLPDRSSSERRERSEAVVEFFHLHCFLTRVGNKWKQEIGEWGCGLCEADFWDDPFAFRIRIGRIDFETAIFDPFAHPSNQGLLCSDCTAFNFGEGDIEEGRRILGAA